MRRVLAASILSFALGACTESPPQASRSPSPTLAPNPFTIVARYSAVSLGLRRPIALAIGPDGIYVTDIPGSVKVIAPDGKVLRSWTSPTAGPGRFSFPPHRGDPSDRHGAIGVGPDGKVYVADSGDNRVVVFSPSGSFVRSFGGYGSGDGRFLDIGTLTIDGKGDVYVVDESKETIFKFSPDGRLLWRLGGSSGAESPNLVGHFSLADVDSHGRLVASRNEGAIVYIDGNGDEVDHFDLEDPGLATINRSGFVAVQSSWGDRGYETTLLFDRAHHLVGMWKDSGGIAPRFGPNGEAWAIADDGSILRLTVAIPDA
jgi:6-bladed beta-propeller